MSNFDENKIRRAGDGKFTTKGFSEAADGTDADLGGQEMTLDEAIAAGLPLAEIGTERGGVPVIIQSPRTYPFAEGEKEKWRPASAAEYGAYLDEYDDDEYDDDDDADRACLGGHGPNPPAQQADGPETSTSTSSFDTPGGQEMTLDEAIAAGLPLAEIGTERGGVPVIIQSPRTYPFAEGEKEKWRPASAAEYGAYLDEYDDDDAPPVTSCGSPQANTPG